MGGADERNAAAGDNALFCSRAGGGERVVDAVLLLLHLGLGGSANLDDRNAADKLGETLLELLLVVVALGLFDLRTDLLHAAVDGLALTEAVDDGGVVLGDADLLGAAKVGERHILELHAEVFADDRTAREDGDVAEHGLAAVTEAGRLDGGHVQRATELVDDEGGERLALDLLGDDDEGLAAAGRRLEDGEKVAHVRHLLLVEENEGVIELGRHAVCVGDKVGRHVATVELHALDNLELGLHALGLFDGDDAVGANLLHRLGDEVTDGLVAVGRDGADLADLLGIAGGLGRLLDLGDDRLDAGVDATLERHGVVAGRDKLHAFAEDGLGEDRRGGGAVAGHIGRLLGGFTDHLGAEVLELVGKLDLLGNRDAVLGDLGATEGLLDHDVAALGPKRDLDRLGEDGDAAKHAATGFFLEDNFFGRHD